MTSFSFEVFPPKSADGVAALAGTVSQLGAADPEFVSVTYGAGGSDRQRTFDAISAVTATGVVVAGHLTCVGQSRADVESVIERYEQLGVTQVIALRGDPPSGPGTDYSAHDDGFQHTAELVATLAARGVFRVAVSAYPERHPQSPSFDHDLDVLAAKVDAGADQAITQMFFDNVSFLRYRDWVAARGISVEVIPGVFPIHSLAAVQRFAERCGATIPTSVADRFDGCTDELAASGVAAEFAAEQIAELSAEGVDHVHLYTLNRAELVLAVRDHLLQGVGR